MDSERPIWRMTECERQTLRDMDAFASQLNTPNVPQELILLVTKARKDGNPLNFMVSLMKLGFVKRKTMQDGKTVWYRTSKPIPTNLHGMLPNNLPAGAIARLSKFWKEGRCNLTVDDMIALRAVDDHELPIRQ